MYTGSILALISHLIMFLELKAEHNDFGNRIYNAYVTLLKKRSCE